MKKTSVVFYFTLMTCCVFIQYGYLNASYDMALPLTFNQSGPITDDKKEKRENILVLDDDYILVRETDESIIHNNALISAMTSYPFKIYFF